MRVAEGFIDSLDARIQRDETGWRHLLCLLLVRLLLDDASEVASSSKNSGLFRDFLMASGPYASGDDTRRARVRGGD